MTRPQDDVRKRVEELFLDRALWGLDARAEDELERLFAEDGARAREAEGYEDTVAALQVAMGASSAAALEPMPDGLADRLFADAEATLGTGIASVTRETADPPALDAGPAPVPLRRISPSWWLAAAALLLAFGFWNRMLPTRDASSPNSATSLEALVAALDRDANSVTLPWTVTEDPIAQGTEGRVVWNAERQEGYMTFRGGAPNDPSESQFQLWIFDEARPETTPVDGGVFDISEGLSDGGEWIVPIRSKLKVSKATLFAVTAEEPGGVVVSDREHIVLVAAP